MKTTQMKKRYFALIACTLLSSCAGFEPMYGTAFKTKESAETQSVLSEVAIDNLKDSAGVYLRNDLIDRFYTNGTPTNPKYTLSLSDISESIIDLDITKSSDATRGQLRLNTTMYLRDMQTNEVVLERPLHAVSSYNILTSKFATRVTEESTRKNALDNLARQIEQQIGLYLKR